RRGGRSGAQAAAATGGARVAPERRGSRRPGRSPCAEGRGCGPLRAGQAVVSFKERRPRRGRSPSRPGKYPMPHLFGCPCGQQFAVRPETLGQNVRCPHCSRVLHVPAPASPPPVPAAAAPLPPSAPARPFGAAAAILLVLATGVGTLLYQHLQTIPDDPPVPQAQIDKAPPKTPQTPPKPEKPEKKVPERPRTVDTTRSPETAAPPRLATDDVEQRLRLLTRVNAFRAASGLAPVTLAARRSRDCRAHAEYLAQNADKLSGRSAALHDEDASLPGFSKEGQAVARRGVVARGEPVAALDALMASAVRRLRVLDPGLLHVGVGAARDSTGAWVSVFDFD